MYDNIHFHCTSLDHFALGAKRIEQHYSSTILNSIQICNYLTFSSIYYFFLTKRMPIRDLVYEKDYLVLIPVGWPGIIESLILIR